MENSAIEWTNHSWNLVWGCLKVSPGCNNCYAETLAKRYGHKVWGPAKTTERRTMSDAYWQEPLKWNKKAGQLCQRHRVFCSSMADVFEDHPTNNRERSKLWKLIRDTPNLDWLLLTKRPENVMYMIPGGWRDGLPRNIWIGTSVESQEWADRRIPELLKVPAAVRFLSVEPLLGPVDLSKWLSASCMECGKPGPFMEDHTHADGHRYPYVTPWNTIEWIIVGGESGPGARPMNLKWVYDLRDQCTAAGVPFFYKQHGEWIAYHLVREWKPDPLLMERFGMTEEEAYGWVTKPEWEEVVRNAKDWGIVQYDGSYLQKTTTWNSRQMAEEDEWEHTVYKVGKKVAGRLLDGREWNEFPQVEVVP